MKSRHSHTRASTNSFARTASLNLPLTDEVVELGPLKAMFATAVEDGTLRSNPTTGIRVNGRDDREEERETKAMTREELSRLLIELPGDWRLFFESLAHTGLRISEALGLEWPDVRVGNRPTLRVRRQHYRGETRRLKSRNGRRELPLSTRLARRLWVARPTNIDRAMFATCNGTDYSDRNVRRVLDRAAKRARVPWVSFHSFRHTCASLLFEGGKNIRQVCGWLGHAGPAFAL
jgi:integrase